MAYQGAFTQWGIPAAGLFCSDVNSTMLISQDIAYAYLLESGYVDSLLSPVEGAPVAQGQTQTQAQGQAQVKGKDVPVAQGQTQAQGQAHVKGKDVPVAQGQTQAQVKIKDVPVAQGQAQTKGKLIPSQQGKSSGMIVRTDLDIRRFVDYTNALTDDEVLLIRENFDSEFLRDLNSQMRYMCNE